MATLPTYHSGQNLQTPRQVNAGQTFRQLGQLGQDIVGAVDRRDEAALEFDTRMEMANAKNQSDSAFEGAQNDLTLLGEQFNADLKKDATSVDIKAYDKKVDEISTKYGDRIDEGWAQEKYYDKMGDTVGKLTTQAKAARNTAIIEHGTNNLNNTISSLRDVDPRLRMPRLNNELMEAGKFGYINSDQANEMSQKAIAGWAAYDAEESPERAAEVLQKLADAKDTTYPLESEAKTKTFNAVKAIFDRQEKAAKVATAISGVTGQEDAEAIVDNKEMSYEDQYWAIENLDMSDTDKKTAHKNLKSSKKIDAKTDKMVLMQVGVQLDALQGQYKDNIEDTEATDYLKKVQKIKDNVINQYSDGKLSYDNYLSIKKKIDNASTAKIMQASGELKEQDEYWGWTSFGNSDAIAAFKKEFGDDAEAANAFSNYYNAIDILDSDPKAQKRWEKKHGAEWDNSNDNREFLAEDVIENKRKQDRNSAIRLTTLYSREQTAEQFLKRIGVAEEEIQQTMKNRNVTREEVLKRLGYNG